MIIVTFFVVLHIFRDDIVDIFTNTQNGTITVRTIRIGETILKVRA